MTIKNKPLPKHSRAISRVQKPSETALTKVYFHGSCKAGGIIKVSAKVGGRLLFGSLPHKLPVNEAAWLAMLWAIDAAAEEGCRSIIVLGHNKVVIDLAVGRSKIKNSKFLDYLQELNKRRGQFHRCEIAYVPRAQNPARKQ